MTQAKTSEAADWIKKAAEEIYELWNGWLAQLVRAEVPDLKATDIKPALAEVIARNVFQPQLGEISICPRCEGFGIYNRGYCSLCAGSGRIDKDGLAFVSRVVPQGSASEPIDENAEYQKWWNAQTLKGDPAKIPNKCRAGWNARAELAARDVPQSPKVLEISESDLRGVFGHKCDQPDCPVCNPKGGR